MLSAALALSGCTDERLDDGRDGTPPPYSSEGSVTAVQHVIENPYAYADQRITVTGEVVDVWSPAAFTIAGEQFPRSRALLIIASDPARLTDDPAGGANPRGTLVRVTGTVRLDTLDDVEREIGIDLRPGVDSLARVTGPILVAENIGVLRR